MCLCSAFKHQPLFGALITQHGYVSLRNPSRSPPPHRRTRPSLHQLICMVCYSAVRKKINLVPEWSFQLHLGVLPNSAWNSAALSGLGRLPVYKNVLTPNGFRRRATACPRNKKRPHLHMLYSVCCTKYTMNPAHGDPLFLQQQHLSRATLTAQNRAYYSSIFQQGCRMHPYCSINCNATCHVHWEITPNAPTRFVRDFPFIQKTTRSHSLQGKWMSFWLVK